MIALLLQLGGGSLFSAQSEAADAIEDSSFGSTQWEGGGNDSDQVEDGVSSDASLEPVAASTSKLAREPARKQRLHPGYAGSVERPPDAAT